MPNSSRTGVSFEESVRTGFLNAKKDISSLKDENKDIKSIMVSIYNELEELKEKNRFLQDLVKNQADIVASLVKLNSSERQIHPLSSDGTSSTGNGRVPAPAERELVRVFKKNKPQIVKSKILELAYQDDSVLYDIYHEIVSVKGLCGKTTFYRYIRDLEVEGSVEINLIDGKRILRCTSSDTV